MKHILIAVFILLSFDAFAQAERRESNTLGNTAESSDSSNIIIQTEEPINTQESDNTKRFYDSLKSKTGRSGFTRFVYGTLFRNPPSTRESGGKFVDESKKYKPYRNHTIGEVIIVRHQIYDKGVRGIRRYANAVHRLTRETTIKNDLLFKSGDKLEPELIVHNMQILRSRNYLSEISIDAVPRSDDSTVVNIIINTRDQWTISLDGGWNSNGETMFEVYDANFLGLGDKFSVKTYLDRKPFGYGGNIFKYNVYNLLGSFYHADLEFGRSFHDRGGKVSVYKRFINRTDYMLGAAFDDHKKDYYQLYVDTSAIIKYRYFDGWAGKSHYIKSMRSSVYITGRYENIRFRERPDGPGALGPTMNPAFHNYDNALFGVGFYREKFYATNMIYGFGYKEYIAAGYKTELVTGYSWGEFRNDVYLGINLKKGGLSHLGYFMGTATLGSYVDPDKGTWWRSGVYFDTRWVSNLWTAGLSRIRQFVTFNYSKGWNRGQGNNEVITFTKQYGPKTMDEWLIGTSRMVLNTETVVFTPFHPLGFRMALFGFADFGLLGFDPNPFENSFFSTLGFGIRLKNERLVFKTIQLRLGIAFGKKGIIHNQYVRLSNEQRLYLYRFIPSYPEVVKFK